MKNIEIITSLKNPLVKRIRRLQEKAKYRLKEEAFWVEGFSILSLAVATKAKIETVVYCDRLLIAEEGRAVLAFCVASGLACIAVSERIFCHLSQRNNPDGLGAVCKVEWQDVRSLLVTESDVVIAAEDLSDPGNLGTILRTIDAVGATALVLLGQSTQPFHPRAVRASRGAIFTVPLYRCSSVVALLEWATIQRIQTIATSAKADLSFWKGIYRFPVLFLFGNEHRGLDAVARKTVDQVVAVPMGGKVSSLNISVAVSLVLYEVKRQGMV